MKQLRIALISCTLLALAAAWVSHAAQRKPASVLVTIDTPMEPPEWARLERQLLDAHTPAIGEFYRKYYDNRGYVQCVLRWGADDGPDDAFENMAGWPELHAPLSEGKVNRGPSVTVVCAVQPSTTTRE